MLYRGVLLKVTVTLIMPEEREDLWKLKTSQRVWYLRKYLKCEEQGRRGQRTGPGQRVAPLVVTRVPFV